MLLFRDIASDNNADESVTYTVDPAIALLDYGYTTSIRDVKVSNYARTFSARLKKLTLRHENATSPAVSEAWLYHMDGMFSYMREVSPVTVGGVMKAITNLVHMDAIWILRI